MSRYPLSENEEEVLRRRRAGESISSIAAAFGVTRQAVSYFTRKHGVILDIRRKLKVERLQVKCKGCGTRFEVIPSQRARKYCNLACSQANCQRGRKPKLVKAQCAACGKKFERANALVERSKRAGMALTCSRRCAGSLPNRRNR